MALQKIDINTPQPNGKFGESTRSANIKHNSNIAEVGERLEALEDGASGSAAGLQQESQARSAADAELQQAVAQEAEARAGADTQLAARQSQAEEAILRLEAGLQKVPGRNLLINCGIPINQRVFAGGSLAAGLYGYDRWMAGPGGGSVVIDPVTGQFNHNSGPLVQVIKSPERAWGQSLYVSVEDPSGPVQVSVGGATGTISAGTGRRGVQVTPSGSGHMIVQLTATGATYSRPKVERGSVATPLVPDDEALELLLCRRYYRKSYNLDVAPGANSGQGLFVILLQTLPVASYSAGVQIPFDSPMRDTPAVTIYPKYGGPGGFMSDDAAASTRAATVAGAGQSGFFVFASTVPSNQINLQGHWTADAELR